MRVDLYSVIHKAQRYHLFRLSEDIGKTDFDNAEAAAVVARRTLELIENLRDHAKNEQTYIHPLFQSIGAVGEHFDQEHERLELELEKIENLVKEKRWANLYSAYARFLGFYLLHLDEEEAAQRDVLWKHLDDKVLAATFGRFKAERPQHMAKADLEFMLPALSASELVRMFQGMKAG